MLFWNVKGVFSQWGILIFLSQESFWLLGCYVVVKTAKHLHVCLLKTVAGHQYQTRSAALICPQVQLGQTASVLLCFDWVNTQTSLNSSDWTVKEKDVELFFTVIYISFFSFFLVSIKHLKLPSYVAKMVLSLRLVCSLMSLGRILLVALTPGSRKTMNKLLCVPGCWIPLLRTRRL